VRKTNFFTFSQVLASELNFQNTNFPRNSSSNSKSKPVEKLMPGSIQGMELLYFNTITYLTVHCIITQQQIWWRKMY